MPNLFPSTLPVKLKLEVPKTLVQIIKESYNRDQIQLEQNYLQQLQLIMQRYFQQMITIMSDCGLSDINQLTEDFDGNYVKIPGGKSLEHLRDEIVRSQIVRNQKARLFKKTHSVDNTLMHLRSWHAAEQQRERYYGEKYRDSGSYTESHSNAILRQVRRNYDKNYTAALYDMYRYLNSSALLTNDILETTVKEAQAKAMLLKAGVNIFEKEPIILSAEMGGIAGNSGQAGDGKGSGFDEAGSSLSTVSKAESTSQDTHNESSNDAAANNDTNKNLGIFGALSKPLPSSSESKSISFDSLPDIVKRGSGDGFGGSINNNINFDNLPSITKESSGGFLDNIGEYIYKSTGNNLLGAIAGSYVQNRINKGTRIGGIKINKNGISYGKVSYNGKEVKYGNVSYDGKNIKYKNISYDGGEITKDKVINMLKDGGYLNDDIAEIINIGNKEQASELIKNKLQAYIAEKGKLEEALKNGDKAAEKTVSELAEKCRQLLLVYQKILK